MLMLVRLRLVVHPGRRESPARGPDRSQGWIESGGVKCSGLGSEAGEEGIHEFCELKAIAASAPQAH